MARPDYNVCVAVEKRPRPNDPPVPDGEKPPAYWHTIGAAWKKADGSLFIKLNSLPFERDLHLFTTDRVNP